MYDVLKVGGRDGALKAYCLPLPPAARLDRFFLHVRCGRMLRPVEHGGRVGLPIDSNGPLPDILVADSMLLPTYNEDPHHLTARLARDV